MLREQVEEERHENESDNNPEDDFIDQVSGRSLHEECDRA